MAKRGRKPRDPKLNKTAVLSARISASLRKRLEAAASASGRSITEEVETLLWVALNREATEKEMWGGEGQRAVLRLISLVWKQVEFVASIPGEGKWVRWLEDRRVHDEAVDAAVELLAAMKPKGRGAPPRGREFYRGIGIEIARGLLAYGAMVDAKAWQSDSLQGEARKFLSRAKPVLRLGKKR